MNFESNGQSDVVGEMLNHLRSTFPDTDPSSQIAKFYANKSVFITGATGFIGKSLVEKLVRTCKDIERIYLLIREKKGKGIQERLQDLIQSQVFNRIKAYPEGARLLEEKLRVIKGDITLPKFGISPEDMELLSNEVSIVFNSAATVRFVEPIDIAVRNNIRSVNELFEVCNDLGNLQALVHLSTAYSNCHKRDTIYEIFYEPPMSGKQIIEATDALKKLSTEIHTYPHKKVDKNDPSTIELQKRGNGCNAGEAHDALMDNGQLDRDSCEQQVFYREKNKVSGEDLLSEFTRISLRCSNRPNTYTFTKAISESYVLDLASARKDRYLFDKIPVAVVRPSIVCGAWREPDVGLVDNYNGPTGAILSLYTGALQAMPGVGERVADLVPVDMVVNMVLCTAWYLMSEDESKKTGKSSKMGQRQVKQDRGLYVFNFVSGFRNPLRWHQVTDLIRELSYKYPSKYIFRLPGSYFLRAGSFYNLYDWLNHKLPSMMVDYVRTKIFRQELTPRSSALESYGRIRQMTETLTPFTSNQWRLCDANVCALYDRLSGVDKDLFEFDVAKINWTEYIRNYIIGARIYTLKDAAKNVPAAIESLKRRQIANRIGLTILAILIYILFLQP